MPVHTRALVPHVVRDSSLSTPIKVASVGLAVAVTAASAQFTLPVPFSPVPFTFTPMAVILAGAVLGARLGAASQALYVLLGAAGLAVFAPSATLPPGPLRLIGPTGGYLLSYPLAALVTGLLVERGWGARYVTSLLAMLAGLAVIYAGGVAWLTVAFGNSLSTGVAFGITPFLVMDVLKLVAAAAILPSAWRLIGRARRS